MSLILAVDPGKEGAFALIDAHRPAEVLAHWPMPLEQCEKSKAKGASLSVSPRGLLKLFRDIELMHGTPTLYVVEGVGGRPAQSASAAFTFGTGYGMLLLGGDMLNWPRATVPPATWTQKLKAPKDKKARPSFAGNLFPRSAGIFKPKDDGLADAALLALYAARHILGNH